MFAVQELQRVGVAAQCKAVRSMPELPCFQGCLHLAGTAPLQWVGAPNLGEARTPASAPAVNTSSSYIRPLFNLELSTIEATSHQTIDLPQLSPPGYCASLAPTFLLLPPQYSNPTDKTTKKKRWPSPKRKSQSTTSPTSRTPRTMPSPTTSTRSASRNRIP